MPAFCIWDFSPEGQFGEPLLAVTKLPTSRSIFSCLCGPSLPRESSVYCDAPCLRQTYPFSLPGRTASLGRRPDESGARPPLWRTASRRPTSPPRRPARPSPPPPGTTPAGTPSPPRTAALAAPGTPVSRTAGRTPRTPRRTRCARSSCPAPGR